MNHSCTMLNLPWYLAARTGNKPANPCVPHGACVHLIMRCRPSHEAAIPHVPWPGWHVCLLGFYRRHGLDFFWWDAWIPFSSGWARGLATCCKSTGHGRHETCSPPARSWSRPLFFYPPWNSFLTHESTSFSKIGIHLSVKINVVCGPQSRKPTIIPL